ncbi:MAG: choline-sulfatase, partial [Rhodospirillales bacterium]|nr:choline-sulfatase [Rhodospirillales bacterium]
ERPGEALPPPLLWSGRESKKLIWTPEDPPLLFDLDADPDEIENLAGTPASSGVQAELEAVAARTWDVSALDRAVRESQAARRLVSGALGTGARTSWDFQPGRDASKAYFRESGDIQKSYSGFLR